MRDPDSWIQTYTGRAFWPLDPNSEDVAIEDIAHALALQCRFSGHTKWPYSVAQHSVLVSLAVPVEHALVGLLHDAAEAYLVDLPRPLKRSIPDYKVAETRVWAAIAERFGLPLEIPAEVHHADNVLLATEKRDLMAPPPREWALLPPPQIQAIERWDWYHAEQTFLQHFHAFGGK